MFYRIEYRHDPRSPTLVVDGEIDQCARDDLVFAGGMAAPPAGGGVLVLDLVGVTLMDRFGARAVLELRSALCRRATKLRLVNVPPSVAQAFHQIGVPTMVRSS